MYTFNYRRNLVSDISYITIAIAIDNHVPSVIDTSEIHCHCTNIVYMVLNCLIFALMILQSSRYLTYIYTRLKLVDLVLAVAELLQVAVELTLV